MPEASRASSRLWSNFCRDFIDAPTARQLIYRHIAWMTALGNDYAYDQIFVRQLMNYARPGDMVLALSVSGNSPNVIKALEWAVANDVHVVALVGAKRGRMAEIAHQTIVIDSTHYGRVEDAQMGICHMLCYAFMENPEWGK